MRNYGRHNSRGEYRGNYQNDSYDKTGTGLEKGHFPDTIATILQIGVQAIVGPGQDQEQVHIETEGI